MSLEFGPIGKRSIGILREMGLCSQHLLCIGQNARFA